MPVKTKELSSEPGRLVCGCFGVTEGHIREYFEHPHASVDEFADISGITTKCTACKMDFELVLESIRTRDTKVVERVDHERVVASGNTSRDFVDSGFLINSNGIKTVLRVDNATNPFDPKSEELLTDYSWQLRVMDETGKRCAKRNGFIQIGESLTLDLTELEQCPDFGWFWIWLQPRSGGYFGAIRPQYALVGEGWISTVHTQPHAMACYEKAVIIRSPEENFSTLVSVVNGDSRKSATCEFILASTTSESAETRFIQLPPNGSRLVEIDTEFEQAAKSYDVATLIIRSDRPVRKHVIKIQPNGHYSIDHFPDAK